MGQYYHPTFLKKNWKLANNPVKKAFYSWDYGNGAKLMEHSYVGNNFVSAMCHLLATSDYGTPFVWCGDYADEVQTNKGTFDIYGCGCVDEAIARSSDADKQDIPAYKYIVNLTKKEYCEVPEHRSGQLVVHPLPLLTSSGNGRGGGDYRLEDERVGRWAFDRIGVTNDKANVQDFKKIDGYFEFDD